MLCRTLSILLGAALVIALPSSELKSRQDEVVLTVTDFVAFVADPYVEGAQSNLSFHVVDSRPGLSAEVDCVIPPTYFNLYAISALFDWCGDRDLDVSYRYTETGLTVRRGWSVDNSTYMTGSSTQNSVWVEEGEDANVTTLADGKLYARKHEWLFPLSVRAADTP